MTSDTALRLAKFFRTTPEFWMNLQASYDLKIELRELEAELDKIAEINEADYAGQLKYG